MALYEYTALSNNREGHVETGRIIARDKIDAFDKLKRNDMKLLKLRKIDGFSALFSRRTADIR